MIRKPAVSDDFFASVFITIWLNAFLNSSESLERCFDALKPVIHEVDFETVSMNLFDFLGFIKNNQVLKARNHLLASGALDGLVDTGEYLDLALQEGQAISLLGQNNFALVPNLEQWKLFKIHQVPKMQVPYWREAESEFTKFIYEIGDHLEAFDLVAKNDDARELLVNLDHKIQYLEFPENQPHKITDLLGRITRTLAIGLLAKDSWAPSASSKKDQIFKEKVEELITRSRAFLSQISNYAYKNES